MSIKDRGLLKWAPALFTVEHRQLLREFNDDYHRTQKPILDEFEIEELENRICEGMEYNNAIKLSIWNDGFTYEVTGRVHYLDPIYKEVRLVTDKGEVYRVKFADIVGVIVIE